MVLSVMHACVGVGVRLLHDTHTTQAITSRFWLHR